MTDSSPATAATLHSQPYKLPRSVYEHYVAMRWLSRRGWWLLGVPVLAAAVASIATADWRWLLLCLLYVFVISPGIISIAYFRYLLTPEARLTALPKSLVITPGKSITIHYHRPDTPEGDEDADTDTWMPHDETIGWAEVRRITHYRGCYVIELKPVKWPRFLLVPRRSLDGMIADEWMRGVSSPERSGSGG